MGKWLMQLGPVVFALFGLMMTGCPSQESEEPPEPVSTESMPPPVEDDGEKPKEREPKPIDVSETLQTLEAKPTKIPEVKLPQTLLETCRVAVGDAFPSGEVATLDGETKPVGGLFGPEATVVFFWTRGDSEITEKVAVQTLEDLQGDALAEYGDEGLAVVAINVNDPPAQVQQLVESIDVAYPLLVDPDGSYFAKVATGELPRVYVLGEGSEIVWFDVGFSELTREALKRTLRVMLAEPQSDEQ